ncbi:MAG: transcriptional regulator [Deltaproteobacteria bacterium]|nr:transcriptional regulator [Deltaproteobacteria bacterium]
MATKSEIKNRRASYHKDLIRSLRDPEEAAGYLTASLELGEPDVFLIALRNVAEAHGGLLKLSRKTKLNRANLYCMLSKKGNPELFSLELLLKSFGLRLAVEVDSEKKAA